MGGPSFSNRKQGVKEEQIHVLPKIHQSHHQSLHVTRSINSKKKQGGLDMANDDHILTTMRFIPRHEVVQKIKSAAKVTRSGKKKQITKGLETLSEIALSEAEQAKMMMIDKKDDDDRGDDDEWTDSDNDDDDFVHPKLSTHDEEDKEEDSFDPRVKTPSHVGSTDDEDSNKEIHVNPEGQQQSFYVSSGFVSNMLKPSPDTGIDSILNLNTESTSLVDVPTPVPTPVNVPCSSLQDLPNFGSLFGFDHRLKTLEINFSKFKQTNQFAEAVSSILGIVDSYLANKMNEAIKTAVRLQSDKLRDEAQAKNEDFLNKLDENIQKILKEKVKEQKQAKPSTPDCDWNKTLHAAHGPTQPWISNLARKDDSRNSFNELTDTPLDFSAFMMNQFKVDTLTPKLLAGLPFKLVKGSCKGLVELEYFFEEGYKATTN
nr:hypothetical protein [Tanacetum cinerariifolium]